ncbi:DUF58 domain-containing protein [Eubacterium sp.]|uniref:DUF58 domain-containing protein n=1 Tax=Eubacterium sp. TaxID=142586 RepID=UPI00258D5181|nr:DUF58 domain-containing protein [Eubacterium sp.]MCR5367667.1 DUF58 domain-containing protein [Eubacterium sp.]
MKLIIAFIALYIIFAFQKELYRRNWNKGLSAKISFDRNYIEYGEENEMKIEISNKKLLPLPVFQLKYSIDKSLVFNDEKNSTITDLCYRNEVFSVLANQKITRKYIIRGTRRGFFLVSNGTIQVRDFFLISTFARQVDNDAIIYVFPRKIRTDSFDNMMRGIMGEVSAKRSLIYDNLSFRGIREYTRTDSQKSINWRQTAKRNDLMVNLYDYTMDREVKIFLNLEADNMIATGYLLEETICLASSIARRLLERKIAVSFFSNGYMRDIRSGEALSLSGDVSELHTNRDIPCPYVGKGADLSHSITIDKSLSSITSTGATEEFMKILKKETKYGAQNIQYIIISPYHREDLLTEVDKMNRNNLAVTMVVPHYDTIPLREKRSYMYGWEVEKNDS